MWPLFLLIGLFTIFCFIKVKTCINYWKNKGIKHVRPMPFLGNMGELLFNKKSFAEITQDIYNAFPDERYVGYHQFSEPSLLIRDPNLIKQIMVKDFDHFPEHPLVVPLGVDHIWDKTLFGMRSSNGWRDIRSTLSPSFSSLKLRTMFELMKATATQFTEYYKNQNGAITVEMKDVFTRFANDIIATTIFGVTCDSLMNPENEFYLMGKELTDLSGIRSLIFFAHTISPTFMKIFNVSVVTKRTKRFFDSVIKETLQLRKEQGIVRPDLVHTLMQAQKSRLDTIKEEIARARQQKGEITDDDITAQALDMFMAGFETTSNLLGFMTYELALNPDVQDKLREEIDNYMDKNNGVLEYESLLNLQYLDMVVFETLRKWPPSEFTDRQCVKSYTIEPILANEKPLHLDNHTHCFIPIYAIQRDPIYYPDPEKFDPERFDAEHKKSRNPFTFLPFGGGPRNCIGGRFALLTSKLIMFEVVRKFRIVPVKDTQIPLKLMGGTMNMVTEKGIWLAIEPREL